MRKPWRGKKAKELGQRKTDERWADYMKRKTGQSKFKGKAH